MDGSTGCCGCGRERERLRLELLVHTYIEGDLFSQTVVNLRIRSTVYILEHISERVCLCCVRLSTLVEYKCYSLKDCFIIDTTSASTGNHIGLYSTPICPFPLGILFGVCHCCCHQHHRSTIYWRTPPSPLLSTTRHMLQTHPPHFT